MDSRRTATRSSSANGRAANGVSGRPGGCSYLSNVRPENRSTLCSVIAQLTEETQPLYETTLRSRAVSEKCNVKFSCVVTGHPTPQVIWYKDDVQLDRFCGLPKYEIFRNGKSHSLHIYDCTMEDAAIYQASASNIKGIVSCSGVLEVGDMNEFKIHQRYFAKIKQKAEHRCKEVEGKENLEPLRTMSPDRTQRKRRSTMEAFLSTPSSTEDEVNGGSNWDTAVETESRLQEAAVDDAEEKLPPATGGVASAVAKESGNKTQESKTPSVKKKIKICSGTKSETPGQSVSEKTKDNSASSAESSGNTEEVMDIENIVGSDAKNIQRCHKLAAIEAASRRKPSKAEPVCADNKQLTASTVTITSKNHPASGAQGQQKRVGSEATKDDHGPSRTSTKPKVLPIARQCDAVDAKTDSSAGSLLHGRLESADTSHASRAPCKQVGDQLSEKETSQANVRVCPPARPSEAAPAQRTRNDTPVGLELPPSWRRMDVPTPTQKSPWRTTGAAWGFSGNAGLQAPIAEPARGTRNHSRGSSESNMVLFTDLHKPPQQSPDDAEALPTSMQRTANAGDGTEIRADKEVGKDDGVASSESTVHKEKGTETSPEVLMVKPEQPEPAQPCSTITLKSTNKVEEIIDFKEIPKHVSKVISIAELLRAQLVALDSMLPVLAAQADIEPVTESSQRLTEDDRKYKQEAKMEKKMETHSTEQHQTPPGEALPKPPLSLPASGIEPTARPKHHGSKETEASTQINDPVVMLTQKENEAFDTLTSGKVSSQTPNEDSEPDQVMELPEIQLSSNCDMGSSRPLDRCQTDDHSINSEQMFLTRSANEENHLEQTSSVVEVSAGETVLERRNCVSATPRELASGARRKVPTPKTKAEEAPADGKLSTGASPSSSRRSPLLQPPDERISPVESRSPLASRRRNQQLAEDESQGKPAVKHDPFKAPQVIRKIRSETFADASGHLKLWCQFFNVLSDSTIRWYKDEEEVTQIKRKAGDETQVNLAIVQTSRRDSGIYRCSITNKYGTDSTDLLLGTDRLLLHEDLGAGEEIEMTPLLFSKGVSDTGTWGNRLFGRIMIQESHVGNGCSHKVWRAKVIYGLEPVFESGHTCVIKVPNPISYGGKEDSCLVDQNLETVKQGCKIQNLAREYCKIFSAEARLVESFGPCLEVIPVYLMYRPANPVPYAIVEADLTGHYQKYTFLDATGRTEMRTSSLVEQKCCALQHWIHQWTNGNLLVTRLEGVNTKITNVGISVKSTGHQGLPIEAKPKVFEQFVSLHQCNYFCGLLGLRSLKVMDSLTLAKPKASRSPLLQRKMAAGSSSPQSGCKAADSPQLARQAEQDAQQTKNSQCSQKSTRRCAMNVS